MLKKDRTDFSAKPNPLNGRVRLISGNWKMNHTHLEAIAALQKLSFLLKPSDFNFAEISIHAPFTDIRSLQLLIETDRMPFSLGAQNCFFESRGAFTGEISPVMLARLSVKYVIVGHSERRDLFHETDDDVRRKVLAVLENGMLPILCVGESFAEREAGDRDRVIDRQVATAVAALTPERARSVVFAYEPKWAIGSGLAATLEDAIEGAHAIRGVVERLHDLETAAAVRVQYGGSVTSANAREFLTASEVDGLLVGGASLDPDSFARVIQA